MSILGNGGGSFNALGASEDDSIAKNILKVVEKQPTPPYPTRNEQITIVPSTAGNNK
jgi:hypothetical protein